MKQGGGKRKGSEFERLVCKELSKWISYGERDDLFWRSAMSGGRSTVQRKQGKDAVSQAGDISSIDKLGNDFIEKFYVECKFYKDLQLLQLINGGSGNFIQFWDTAKEEANYYKKEPLLIVKQNRLKPLLCIQKKTYNKLYKVIGGELKKILIAEFPKHDLMVYSFDEFLSLIDPCFVEALK